MGKHSMVPDAMVHEALDTLRAFLHRRSLRATGVREAIVRAAVLFPRHFHAEELAEKARAGGVVVSRVSVYRTLPLLVEAGIIRRVEVAGNRRYYAAALGR